MTEQDRFYMGILMVCAVAMGFAAGNIVADVLWDLEGWMVAVKTAVAGLGGAVVGFLVFLVYARSWGAAQADAREEEA